MPLSLSRPVPETCPSTRPRASPCPPGDNDRGSAVAACAVMLQGADGLGGVPSPGEGVQESFWKEMLSKRSHER